MSAKAEIWAVILAAGQGKRLAAALNGQAKQFLSWQGVPLYWHSARTFARVPEISGLVFVFAPEEFERAGQALAELNAARDLGLPYRLAKGGARRQDSVQGGLAVLPGLCKYVLVHDGARPFVSAGLIRRVCEALLTGAQGVIPALALKDTVKIVRQGLVQSTLNRAELAAVQTPQGFERQSLLEAFKRAGESGLDVTDDASLLEACGQEVRVVEGEEENLKITTAADLRHLSENARECALIPVSGFGYDVHRYAEPASDPAKRRPMKLGGEPIESGPDVLAHSDGDVLLHALADALLGCLGQGDIGQHFPDSDPSFSGIESSILVSEVLARFAGAGLRLTHADLTVVAQIPKIAPQRERIRKNLAGLLGLDVSSVNLKATTEEHLGFTGEKKGIKAYALVSALKRPGQAA